jgi:hypothetical protein
VSGCSHVTGSPTAADRQAVAGLAEMPVFAMQPEGFTPEILVVQPHTSGGTYNQSGHVDRRWVGSATTTIEAARDVARRVAADFVADGWINSNGTCGPSLWAYRTASHATSVLIAAGTDPQSGVATITVSVSVGSDADPTWPRPDTGDPLCDA